MSAPLLRSYQLDVIAETTRHEFNRRDGAPTRERLSNRRAGATP
jgi:hypothetical protein